MSTLFALFAFRPLLEKTLLGTLLVCVFRTLGTFLFMEQIQLPRQASVSPSHAGACFLRGEVSFFPQKRTRRGRRLWFFSALLSLSFIFGIGTWQSICARRYTRIWLGLRMRSVRIHL